jgi:ATP-dependent helicase/nuclease subunit A
VYEVLASVNPELYERLKIVVDRAAVLGPYSFFSYILDGGGRHNFLTALGPQVIDPLEEFMTICLSYERTQPGTLHHFLKWFITGGSEIKRDINASSGVRVATVHGSKGLEAPVVFLVDTTRIPSGDSVVSITPEIAPKNVPVDASAPTPWLWVANSVPSERLGVANDAAMAGRFAEYYRLLYVAMTRARDELYVYGYVSGKNANAKSWYALLWDTLKTIPDATVEDDKIRIIHGK